MKKYLFYLSAVFTITSCNNSDNKEATSNNDSLKKDILIDSTEIKNALLKSKINEYVTNFYNSLELTKQENQDAYESGKLFNKEKWKQFLTPNVSYSKKRVEQLTGNHHYMFGISLIKIQDILIDGNNIVVKTQVEYAISELGVFQNEEEIALIYKKPNLDFLSWHDIKPKLIEKMEYEGLESLKADELYKILGINK